MIDLSERIRIIEALVEEGTDSSLVYAALESRLTIEAICYERLKFVYEYASYEEFRKWQPGAVVNYLVEELGENSVREFTLSIAPGTSETYGGMKANEIPDEEFIPIGTQLSIDAKLLSKLWHSLASFLHVQIPKGQDSEVSVYGIQNDIRSKITDSLNEFKRLSKASLISSGLAPQITFICKCGRENKRRVSEAGERIVNCINKTCKESWSIKKINDEWAPKRREINVLCVKCEYESTFPSRVLTEIPCGSGISFTCKKCDHMNHISWVLMRLAADQSESDA